MIILHQKIIMRSDIQANRHALYIFGDNLDRKGFGGQAKEMRGEPNSFGIATKRSITHNYPDDYFHDAEDDVRDIIIKEFINLNRHLSYYEYDAIIIPLDGIGTGIAKMPEYAPKALEFINQQFIILKGSYQ